MNCWILDSLMIAAILRPKFCNNYFKVILFTKFPVIS